MSALYDRIINNEIKMKVCLPAISESLFRHGVFSPVASNRPADILQRESQMNVHGCQLRSNFLFWRPHEPLCRTATCLGSSLHACYSSSAVAVD